MRKQLPLILTGIAALIVIGSQFIAVLSEGDWFGVANRWYLIIISMMVLVGAINLTRIHSTNIARRRAGYGNSILLLVCLWGFMALGLILTGDSETYQWIFQATIVPFGATMFSVIAFFIASAAYRAFRIRTVEAAVMGVVAAIVMLGNVPLGAAIWDGFPQIGGWLMNIPNGAGFRAIRIGLLIGAFAAAIRIALGLERAHLGGGG